MVTGFTVDSYKWLQADPNERAADILQQISNQLSYLVVDNGHITPTQPTALVPDAFIPSQINVKINLLWFISLSLSLTSAFMALAVKQWLRAIPHSRKLSTPQAVIFRHAIYMSLTSWQVANIINLLPVLLQIAVTLFLVGLYLLLQSLSRPVTVAFATITGIPFFLYAVSLFLPLIWHRCPFRTPVVPAVVFLLQLLRAVAVPLCALAYVLCRAFIMLWFVVIASCVRTVAKCFRCQQKGALKFSEWGHKTIMGSGAIIVDDMIGTIISAVTASNDFWTDRAISHISLDFAGDKISPLKNSTLRYCLVALLRARESIPSNELDRVDNFFLTLGPLERAQCVFFWLLGSTRINNLYWDVSADWAIHDVDPWLISQYHSHLLHSVPPSSGWDSPLPQGFSSPAGQDQYSSVILILLTRVLVNVMAGPTHAEFRARVVQTLLRVCRTHYDYENRALPSRYPIVCLFECCYSTDDLDVYDKMYTFNPIGMASLVYVFG